MFEQVELTEPWHALEQAGADVELLSLEPGEIRGSKLVGEIAERVRRRARVGSEAAAS